MFFPPGIFIRRAFPISEAAENRIIAGCLSQWLVETGGSALALTRFTLSVDWHVQAGAVLFFFLFFCPIGQCQGSAELSATFHSAGQRQWRHGERRDAHVCVTACFQALSEGERVWEWRLSLCSSPLTEWNVLTHWGCWPQPLWHLLISEFHWAPRGLITLKHASAFLKIHSGHLLRHWVIILNIH